MQIDPTIWPVFWRALVGGAINVLIAAAILVFGMWVAVWASNTMRKLSRQHPRVDDTLAAFFAWIVRYGLMAFVIVAVLNRFGVATTSIVAVLGASALAIGLALQGTLSNVAAGVMLMLFRPYRLGDYVELAGKSGTVVDVNLFTTDLTTLDNVKIVLPNSLCWGAAMINYTAHPRRRIDLDFAVAYDTNLDKAIDVLKEAMRAEKRVLLEPPPVVYVKQLGDYAVLLTARAWAPTRDYLSIRFALIKASKEALDANGIVIPFPTNTNYEVRIAAASETSRLAG
ncbi:MAG TPA: mechanosensitive ion channel domain-containing protein [Caulobacterales bacterium]|nr:mechanosensitive ion channel domain-containing protein [Caulobacterales bacterium]